MVFGATELASFAPPKRGCSASHFDRPGNQAISRMWLEVWIDAAVAPLAPALEKKQLVRVAGCSDASVCDRRVNNVTRVVVHRACIECNKIVNRVVARTLEPAKSIETFA